MTSVSNNVAAVIHVAGSYLVTWLLSGIIVGTIWTTALLTGSQMVPLMIVSLVMAAVSVYISGNLVKKFFSYPDKNHVVKVSTTINLALTILVSFASLLFSPITTIVRIAGGLAIFYYVSQKAL